MKQISHIDAAPVRMQQTGGIHQETDVPAEEFLREAGARGIPIHFAMN